MEELRRYSHVSSFYPDERPLKKAISKSILDKYINEQHPLLDKIQRSIYRIMPYWSTTANRIFKNFANLIEGTWQFQYLTDAHPQLPSDRKITTSIVQDIQDDSLLGKNVSIYLLIWLPITTMLLAHLLHNQPNRQNYFDVPGAGLIMFGSIIVISYALYVYSNVLGSPYNIYVQHICPSSHMAILGLIFASACAATPNIWLIPMTLVYTCLSIFLHFRMYNNVYKPTLLEMVALFLVISFLYSSAAYLFYINFSSFNKNTTQTILPNVSNVEHFMRVFEPQYHKQIL